MSDTQNISVQFQWRRQAHERIHSPRLVLFVLRERQTSWIPRGWVDFQGTSWKSHIIGGNRFAASTLIQEGFLTQQEAMNSCEGHYLRSLAATECAIPPQGQPEPAEVGS